MKIERVRAVFLITVVCYRNADDHKIHLCRFRKISFARDRGIACAFYFEHNARYSRRLLPKQRKQLLLAQSGRRREVSTRCVEIAQSRARGKPEGLPGSGKARKATSGPGRRI